MKLEDWTDASEVLGGGVYLLLRRGKVVFVGRAKRAMMARIAMHQGIDRPKWSPVPAVKFDQILIRYVHPDQIDSVYFDLVETYKPLANAPLGAPSIPLPFARRL